MPKNAKAWENLDSRRAVAIIYKHGARVFFTATGPRNGLLPPRGDITDQSAASRHRAALAFGNANCLWLAMAVLTWQDAPESAHVKRATRQLRRWWRERWGESMEAWLMEMQARGVPHFHTFHSTESNFGIACRAAPKETLRRRGWPTLVVRGEPEKWLIGAWLECTGQLDSPECLAFNRGGILEILRHSDAAGRYVAKECSKREQKVLPERYADGLGRWWWMARHLAPKEVRRVDLDLDHWPHEIPMSYIWDAETIKACETSALAIPDGVRLYNIRTDRAMPIHPLQLPGGQVFLPGMRKRSDDRPQS